MSDSSRRAIRTLVQALIALLTAVPTIVAHVPAGVVAAQVVAVTAVLAKVINALEESGALPSWLKDVKPVPVPPVAKQVAP